MRRPATAPGSTACCGSTRDASSTSRARSQQDPTFALGHATIALLAAEHGDREHAKIHLHLADRNTVRASARERSAVHALGVVCTGDGPSAFKALVRHLTDYPSDALLLDVAFPTIAFSGVTETSAEVWSLVEDAAPAYGDDWFYLSLLAFVRQEQERYDEALDAGRAGARDRAVLRPRRPRRRARALRDVRLRRRAAVARRLADAAAPRPRPSSAATRRGMPRSTSCAWATSRRSGAGGTPQLAPPESEGLRVLVDAGSMLHRCQLRKVWEVDLPTDQLIDAASPSC